MEYKLTRRDMLISGLGVSTSLMAMSGLSFASTPPPEGEKLSPEEKKALKEQLQRELERKVYSVSDELFRKVNHVKTHGRYEGHEEGHIPVIKTARHVKYLEPFTVKIEVGPKALHDMIPFHYIDWISLAIDNVQINNCILTPLYNRPVVTLELTLERSSTLIAQEHCNLHGIWEGEPFVVEVEPPAE